VKPGIHKVIYGGVDGRVGHCQPVEGQEDVLGGWVCGQVLVVVGDDEVGVVWQPADAEGDHHCDQHAHQLRGGEQEGHNLFFIRSKLICSLRLLLFLNYPTSTLLFSNVAGRKNKKKGPLDCYRKGLFAEEKHKHFVPKGMIFRPFPSSRPFFLLARNVKAESLLSMWTLMAFSSGILHVLYLSGKRESHWGNLLRKHLYHANAHLD